MGYLIRQGIFNQRGGIDQKFIGYPNKLGKLGTSLKGGFKTSALGSNVKDNDLTKFPQQFLYLIVVFVFCFICFGCATSSTTDYIKATSKTNPPPKYEFSRYEKFIAEPIVIAEQFREHRANIGAAATIQEHLDNKLNPLLQSWNKDTKTSELKTLIIKPRIEAIKFIGAGARFWAGGLAGNSGVLMYVTILDQKTGEIIANPEFYQHANAAAGGWSVGATDYAMLNRITDLIVQYMSDNYKNAVGGKTGAEN